MFENSYAFPDESGHFGSFGGIFIPETLIPVVQELKIAFRKYIDDHNFLTEFKSDLAEYVGRPSPLYRAKRLEKHWQGAQIFLKREDLNHTGAHKINHTVGQILLAKRMGKTRIIAETGAGQHGVATASVSARAGLECVIYMGEEDVHRQAANVHRMKLLGAEVRAVSIGSKTLKDAVNAALRDWVVNSDNTYYLLGTVVGPDPYPEMVRTFQSVIGKEVKKQCQDICGCLPNALVACVGGGSNAIGLFSAFIDDLSVKMYGVEGGGDGVKSTRHACRLSENAGRQGVFHGNRTFLMSDEYGNILPSHSVSAGLDYPGVGPEHAWLKSCGRVNYVHALDVEAVEAFHLLAEMEGIIPALESSHALAYASKLATKMKNNEILVINLSGRGDKDMETIMNFVEDK